MRAYGLCQRVHLVFLRLIESKALKAFPISDVLHTPKARAVDEVCPRRRCALTRVAVLRFRLNERPVRRVRRRGCVAVAAACQFVERAVVPNARNLESPRFGVLLLVEVARRSRPQTAVDTLGQRATRRRIAENVLRDDAARKHVIRRTGHGRAEMFAQPRGQLTHHKAVGLRAVDNRSGNLHTAHDTAVGGALHDVALAFRVGRVAPPCQAHQRHGRRIVAFGGLIVGIKARRERPRLGIHRLNTQPRGANFRRAARCSYTIVSTAQNVTGTETGHVALKALLQHHLPAAVGLLFRAFYQSVLSMEDIAFAQCNAVNLIFGGTKETAHRHALKFRVSHRVDARSRAGGQSVGIVRRAQRFGLRGALGLLCTCSRRSVVGSLRTLRPRRGVGSIGMVGRCCIRGGGGMGGLIGTSGSGGTVGGGRMFGCLRRSGLRSLIGAQRVCGLVGRIGV